MAQNRRFVIYILYIIYLPGSEHEPDEVSHVDPIKLGQSASSLHVSGESHNPVDVSQTVNPVPSA